MTNLELVAMTWAEGGLAGPAPTAVIGQTGTRLKTVNWVKNAWIDIQTLYPGGWKFLRKKVQVALTISLRTYPIATAFAEALATARKFDEELLFIRDPATPTVRSRLTFIPYRDFEAQYATFESGQPSAFTLNPSGEIEFNRTPDKAYFVDLNFWRDAVVLAADGDTPAIRAEHHMTIVWYALSRYGTSEGARNEKVDYHREYLSGLRRLEMAELEIGNRAVWAPLA